MIEVHTSWDDLQAHAQHSAAAIGNFDGVHRGHAYLIESLHAAQPGAVLSVITFEPHPREFFRPQDPSFLLTLPEERLAALEQLGIRHVFQIPFTEQFSKLSAQDFIEKVLQQGLKIRHLACGENFAFGHRRGGDVAFLKNQLERLDIGLTTVAPLTDREGPYSSSRIRRLLQEGYMEKAADELGRVWSISGVVQHGDKRGRLLGFPTANIALGRHLEPARGVYATTIMLPNGQVKAGVANIGRRPTINDGQESRLEVNLFDFQGDLYGQILHVSLHHLIREERRFPSLDALKTQIAQDVEHAQKILAERALYPL